MLTPIRAYLFLRSLHRVSLLSNQDLRLTRIKLPSFCHTQITMSSDVSSDVEMLYQEYDRALEEIKFKDRELTSKMKDIHVWFVSWIPPPPQDPAKLKMQDII